MTDREFEALYREYFDPVYRYALGLTRDVHAAEELTQETFYQAVKSIGRFDGSCKLSTWLCQIARHLWYQHLEKHRAERTMTRPLAETPPEDDPAVPSAEEETSARQGHLDLLRQIHDLPDPMREVVYLRAFGGLSFREIGDVLGKTENWARVTFFRGKERLRKDGAFDET